MVTDLNFNNKFESSRSAEKMNTSPTPGGHFVL